MWYRFWNYAWLYLISRSFSLFIRRSPHLVFVETFMNFLLEIILIVLRIRLSKPELLTFLFQCLFMTKIFDTLMKHLLLSFQLFYDIISVFQKLFVASKFSLTVFEIFLHFLVHIFKVFSLFSIGRNV
jgi:hypothetical protein